MSDSEYAAPPCSPSVEEYLAKENCELRRAGCKMAEAALHVAREYDGVHRLMLAVSEWAKVLADEGGRGKAYSAIEPNNKENTSEVDAYLAEHGIDPTAFLARVGKTVRDGYRQYKGMKNNPK
jgi:hypothetical protein